MSRLKQKMEAYRQKKEKAYNYYMSTLQYNKTYLIQDNNSTMCHIISNSFYDKRIQLTCFINGNPYNHITFDTYEELFHYDNSIFMNGYIKESV